MSESRVSRSEAAFPVEDQSEKRRGQRLREGRKIERRVERERNGGRLRAPRGRALRSPSRGRRLRPTRRRRHRPAADLRAAERGEPVGLRNQTGPALAMAVLIRSASSSARRPARPSIGSGASRAHRHSRTPPIRRPTARRHPPGAAHAGSQASCPSRSPAGNARPSLSPVSQPM